MTPSVKPRSASVRQHRLDVIVHLEVMIPGPLLVDSLGNRDHRRSAAAHVLDDRRRVMDKQGIVIDRLLDFVEDERRGRDRRLKPARVDGEPGIRAETRVSFTLKRRAGIDQREVDVEEDGARSNRWRTRDRSSR